MNQSPAPHVFIDTNVWFSAFYGSVNSEKLVKAHIRGNIKAVISQQVLTELVNNISTKIPRALPSLQKFLEAAPPEIVGNPSHISSKIKKLVHPKDAVIFASCLETKVKLFVTGNTKDFDITALKRRFNIVVCTPAEAIKLLRV